MVGAVFETVNMIVILDSPEIYSEYAPYSYVEDMKQFIDMVSQMNRVAQVIKKYYGAVSSSQQGNSNKIADCRD